MSEIVTFGTWLQQRRKALDLTQEKLAERVSCSLTAVQKIESGSRKPSRQIAERLAESLSIPLEQYDSFIMFARSGGGQEFAAQTAQRAPRSSEISFLNARTTQSRLEGESPAVRAGPEPAKEGSRAREGRTEILPTPLTGVVGRSALIKQVQQTLQRSDVRLVTLTGPPGVGKTRLAIEVAHSLLAYAGDGVYFVGLAPVDDPQFVLPTTARVLGLRESGAGSLRDTLVAGLSGKRALLVLDNMEQVIEAAPEVAGLLEECPMLKVLVTSRGRLRVRGERQIEVPPLVLPDPAASLSPEQLLAYPAIELFVQRAEEADPGFALTAENADIVAAICTRLEGLPLAIELAATRIRLLPLDLLLSKLESRLAPLVGGPRDLPARHRTLRAAIAWSYDLLNVGEQALFARLGIFAGGFTLAAAEAVCNAVGDLPFDLLDGVESLVDKGLLRLRNVEFGMRNNDGGVNIPNSTFHIPQSYQDARFSMLESVREFAYDCLRERAEEDAMRRLLAEYCVVLAEAAEPQLEGDAARGWLDLLEWEQDNLRATLSWALERHETALAIRICAAVWKFWRARGYLTEGRRWIEQVLTKSEGADISALTGISPSMYATVLFGAGRLASNQGDYDQAVIQYERAMSYFHQTGDEKGIANCLNSIGVAMHYKSALDEAEHFYEQGLALRRKRDNKKSVAASLNNLALVASARQDREKAIALMEESLEIIREVGNKSDIMSGLYNLGIVLEDEDYSRAVSLFEESLVLANELGDKYSQASGSFKLGQASLMRGELEEAEKRFREGLVLSRALEFKALIAYGLIFLGHAQLRQGDYAGAGVTLREALVMNDELDDRSKLATCLKEFAALAALQGDQSLAARAVIVTLYSASNAIWPATYPYTREYHGTILASARSHLAEDLFQSAWDRGQKLTMQAAVELALAQLHMSPAG